jgi:DNA invertase Pin-like site-specific DNA recombinase
LARGDSIAVWYAEKRSAKTTERAELQRLRADARAGHIRRLYVFRVDRLARSGIRDMFEIVEELRAHGVEVITLADGFSLDGPAAEVVLAVMAWAAKMERLALAERIAAARWRVESEGGRWGRPRRLDGPTRERASDMHSQGKSIREISRALKVPRATVARAVSLKPSPVDSADPAGEPTTQ